MKPILKISILVTMLGVSACNASLNPKQKVSPTEMPKPGNVAQPVLKTSLGDFVIVLSRFVDEIHGTKPGPDEKILLLILSQPGLERLDPATFSLEAFDKMVHDTSKEPIHIIGDDGSNTISTMGGWVDDEFAMGFIVPAAVKRHTLFWQDNPPIEIVVEQAAP